MMEGTEDVRSELFKREALELIEEVPLTAKLYQGPEPFLAAWTFWAGDAQVIGDTDLGYMLIGLAQEINVEIMDAPCSRVVLLALTRGLLAIDDPELFEICARSLAHMIQDLELHKIMHHLESLSDIELGLLTRCICMECSLHTTTFTGTGERLYGEVDADLVCALAILAGYTVKRRSLLNWQFRGRKRPVR